MAEPHALVNPLGCSPASYYGMAMTGKDTTREERLAAALRENLRRRKAQARDSDAQKSEDSQAASE